MAVQHKRAEAWIVAALIVGGVLGFMLAQAPAPTAGISQAEFNLRQGLRLLWADHVQYTRLYIEALASDSPGKNLIAVRLLSNQNQIGDAIKPIYGEAAGNRLADLLKQHILGAVDLLDAAKAGDTAKFAQANATWYQNGNDIADFLSSANPNWPSDVARAHLKEHLDITTLYAVGILIGNYEEANRQYDRAFRHVMTDLADWLADGIVAQFPDRFR